ncbi:ABC transporter ATP-binding protein/permease [Microlunatus soli]|uniref:ABC-type glutathione transport system ATPase component, contains duplicated ATPase domain n=1 Tax=Microlunatus soli TaxID=630515 RepID=A0A1H1YC73_9ACTN|nr:dipeptide ABC transporter ATP-binding protein [Microlunatus soli]SDT19002.1 ABC-type glutathione transport system ATPase component, contains duplicated ATPase domain [Microlunatus soli]
MLSTIRMTRGLQRFMLFAGFAIVAFFILLAIFAPLIAPYGFNADRIGSAVFGTQQHPSAAHWFGTTVGGQDVLSRVVYGARTAVIVIIVAVIISIVVGVPLGLISGYLGGPVDRVLVLIMDAMYSFPSLLLAIVVSIIVGGGQSGLVTGILAAAISITVVFIPQYFRVVRNATVSVKVEPYVDAARVVGARTPRILFKHILSNVAGTLPVIATLNASEAILTLAGLGFLGLGIEPSAAAEWGYDLNRAMSDATNGIWWTGIFPGLAIVLMVLGVTLVGESLNDVLNPLLRTRSGGGSADEQEVASEFESTVGTDAKITEPVVIDDKERKKVATLSLQDLTVRFDTDAGIVNAVNGVSFAVDPGEVVAVVGESGSGKSVSTRAVLGLLPSTAHAAGSAKLRDRELLGLSSGALRPVRGDQISMIFQEPSTALNPVYTVGWQLAEGIRAHRKISRKDARARAIELLDLVGLPDPERRVDYYPHQLSGGQKQRVVIAMAIACEPDVIIADEPTTALDVTVQAAILELLLSLRDRLGTAIVLITHNMGVVADIADRVVVMYRGNVVEEAPVESLFDTPQHPYTQRLLEAVPHLGRGTGTTPAGDKADQLVLTVDDLVVEFPGRIGQPSFRAVDRVGFEIHRGEVLGLVGESGSGKSTVGRTCVGLQKPTSGSVTVSGTEISELTDAQLRSHRGRFGFVFQDPAASLNPHLTIADCIAEPLHVQSPLSAADQRAKVQQLLDRVQLPGNYAGRYPHELSGGQRQRVSLARALALDPDLLIADEPTSALDVSVQARVLELFDELQAELQFACLFISHDLAVVDSLAHRVAVMQHGELVEIGDRQQVLNKPQQDYTKRLIAAVPVPDPAEQHRRREARGKLLTDVS